MPTPFTPQEFLRLARSLAQQDTDEAALRSAVSRAYYALFLLARAKTGVFATGDSHALVFKAMRQRRTLISVASQLETLFKMRKAADYDVIPDSQYRDWKYNWKRASDTVDHILDKLI